MPRYTVSRSRGNGPSRRSSRTDLGTLPHARRRRRRKRGEIYLKHTQGFGRNAPRTRRGRRDGGRRAYALIAVGCALLFFTASIVWYVNRSVEVQLNGSGVSVRIGSTIAQLIEDQGLEPKAGALLAVDDAVLERRGGEAAHVTVDGKHIAPSRFADMALSGGEKVEVGDGEDVYEDHDVQATAIDPVIKMSGSGALTYVRTWGVPGRTEVWTGKVSGKTADRGVVKQVQDCEVVSRSVSPDAKGAKYVALTFDEGPSADTEAIVKILREKKATATFFLSGDAVEANPSAAKAIARAGCEIGTNSYSDTDLTALSGDDLRSQLTRGLDAVRAASKVETALLRAPYAKFSDANWSETMDIVGTVVSWNLDSGDWTLPGADAVAKTVVGGASNGDIVLLTDNASTSAQTLAALPAIIDGLREQGFEFVTVSGLIATDKDLAKELVDPLKASMPEDAVMPKLPDDGAA